jgi:phosphoribosylformylglycinamidine (FGAM) synthase-like enzyme
LMETPEIVKSGASGIGNPVLYVGSTTGRDGMGGASFASAELSDESMDDRPAVQVGDPFLEKALVEACLEAFKTGAVVAAQDMGAAGITCSTSEMAANGGVGVDVDLGQGARAGNGHGPLRIFTVGIPRADAVRGGRRTRAGTDRYFRKMGPPRGGGRPRH